MKTDSTLFVSLLVLFLTGLFPMELGAQPTQRASTQRPSGSTAWRRQGDGAIVIPIKGELSIKTVALVQRGFRVASSEGLAWVILQIDTPGGEIRKMDEIVKLLNVLKKQDVETVAYITDQGFSAGAIIALACDRIYMAGGAKIGAATPIVGRGARGVMEPRAYEKLVSAMRATVRAYVEDKPPSIALMAEAMVDGRIELFEVSYKKKDGVNRKEVVKRETLEEWRQSGYEILDARVLNERQQPLTLTTVEAIRLGLAQGRAETLDDLYAEFGLEPSLVRPPMKPSWSEELASFLDQIKFFLLIAGIVMGVMAFQMPGTGLPEALCLLCLVMYFFGSYLVGIAEWTQILLFVIGVALIIVEIFVVPGTLIAGIGGLVAILAALFLSVHSFGGPSDGLSGLILTDNLWRFIWTLLAVIVMSIVLSRLLPRLPLFNKLMLRSKRPSASYQTTATSELKFAGLVGQLGIAGTDLRPSGKLMIDGDPYDVTAGSTFMSKGSLLRVVEVRGNRILVESAEELEDGSDSGNSGGGSNSEAGLMAIPWLLLLMFGGLIVMVAEVFFPSFGILSVISGVTIVTAIFLSFEHGLAIGCAFLLSALILVPTFLLYAFRYFPETVFGKLLILRGSSFEPGERKLHEDDLETFVGKMARTVTPLRPVGTVSVGRRRLDAMSRGERIETGVEVLILGIEMSQVVVKKKPALGADGGDVQEAIQKKDT